MLEAVENKCNRGDYESNFKLESQKIKPRFSRLGYQN